MYCCMFVDHLGWPFYRISKRWYLGDLGAEMAVNNVANWWGLFSVKNRLSLRRWVYVLPNCMVPRLECTAFAEAFKLNMNNFRFQC